MNNENNNKSQFLYNHSEVIGGVLFLIVVFIVMAIASHFMN